MHFCFTSNNHCYPFSPSNRQVGLTGDNLVSFHCNFMDFLSIFLVDFISSYHCYIISGIQTVLKQVQQTLSTIKKKIIQPCTSINHQVFSSLFQCRKIKEKSNSVGYPLVNKSQLVFQTSFSVGYPFPFSSPPQYEGK